MKVSSYIKQQNLTANDLDIFKFLQISLDIKHVN